MTCVTALLLVLTLTGSPVASVVCGLTCERQPVTTSHCHEAMPANGPAVTAAENCAAPSLSDTPYVVEHRAAVHPAIAVGIFSIVAPVVTPVQRIALAVDHDDGWRTPPIALRI
jgi:hypothetical protein